MSVDTHTQLQTVVNFGLLGLLVSTAMRQFGKINQLPANKLDSIVATSITTTKQLTK